MPCTPGVKFVCDRCGKETFVAANLGNVPNCTKPVYVNPSQPDGWFVRVTSDEYGRAIPTDIICPDHLTKP